MPNTFRPAPLQRSLIAAALLLSPLVPLAVAPVAAQTNAATTTATTANAQTANWQSVAAHYAGLVHANYEDTLASATQLRTAINAFAAAPSAEGLDAAKKAWLAAREFYGQTEAFRFYGGPIDDAKGPEGQLNAWPLDESYIDYVKGKPNAGMINNKKFALSKKTLIANNERGGEENIATGWHAIEFLLWGQDFNDNGPGNRSYEDYVDGKTPNADRRRRYLTLVTEILIDDLNALTKAWAPKAKNYRARFEQAGRVSVQKMLIGIGSLSRGELAGERLEVALASQDQEDEHSCFSDNTHRDAVTNARGIENVWLGRYRRAGGSVVEGPSLRDLVAAKNAELAARTTQQIGQSVKLAEAIQAPFDQEIKGGKDAPGRKRVEATVQSLVQQSKDIVEAASAIGITKLTLVEP